MLEEDAGPLLKQNRKKGVEERRKNIVGCHKKKWVNETLKIKKGVSEREMYIMPYITMKKKGTWDHHPLYNSLFSYFSILYIIYKCAFLLHIAILFKSRLQMLRTNWKRWGLRKKRFKGSFFKTLSKTL